MRSIARLTRLSPLTISSRDRTTRVSRNKAGKTILVQRKPSDKIQLLKIKARGSRHLLPTRRNASSPPVAPNPRRRQIRRQRQQSFSGAQSQSAGNQAQRQQSAGGFQSQATANQAQRQGAAGAQQGQRQAPEGAQHWQGGGGAGRQGGQSPGARSASSGQFGGRQSGGAHEGGAFGGMSSGSRSQSFSQRGGQSMSSMSHSGGGRRR